MSTGDTLSMRKLSSVKDFENQSPVSVIEQAAAFCPQGGLLQGSDCDFNEESAVCWDGDCGQPR